jgi:hypothetical protein
MSDAGRGLARYGVGAGGGGDRWCLTPRRQAGWGGGLARRTRGGGGRGRPLMSDPQAGARVEGLPAVTRGGWRLVSDPSKAGGLGRGLARRN